MTTRTHAALRTIAVPVAGLLTAGVLSAPPAHAHAAPAGRPVLTQALIVAGANVPDTHDTPAPAAALRRHPDLNVLLGAFFASIGHPAGTHPKFDQVTTNGTKRARSGKTVHRTSRPAAGRAQRQR